MGRKCFDIDNREWNKIKGKLIAEFGTVEKGMSVILDRFLKNKINN